MKKQPRIVIAEDETIIRLDLREMLEEEGYSVVGEASDGEAAVKLAQELKPDLVILDIVMPGMDGLAAARLIGEKELSAILILTAFSKRDLVDQAARTGAMAYLVKPFDKADLIPAVEVAIARWEEYRALAEESKDLAERLETRKLVERAKGELMTRLKLSEPDAFKTLQRAAMERRVSLREIAERILEGDDGGLSTS
jgi:response regulator NasT